MQLIFFPCRKRMDLAKRFEEATSSTSFNISSLVMNRLYPIVCAKRINTKFGSTVLLSIRDSNENVQIFLPKRYSDIVSDNDMEKINSKAVYLNLVYKGICDTSKSYLLAIDY